MKHCIYQILNLANGKFYIGHSQDYDIRWWEHERKLKVNKHDNQHLQRAWNKYGKENFEFILIELVHENDMLIKEQYWIDKLGACDHELGYNINPDALRPPSAKGKKHSAETRAKMSIKMTGIKKSDTSKMKKPKSEEHKKALSKARTGLKLSDAGRLARSIAAKAKSSWPHDKGNKCKCDECRQRRNEYYRNKAYHKK